VATLPIRSKTRKRLWGQSGNLCAICRRELVADATPHDEAALVGEECHIASGRPGGPRYDPSFPAEQIDAYRNLILLCAVHHRVVDQQPGSYGADALRGIKAAHELWVSETLQGNARPATPRLRWRRKTVPEHLMRLTSGVALSDLILGAHAYAFDHEDLTSEQETELVGEFLQTCQDYGDIGDDFGAQQRVQMTTELGRSLEELAREGFYVFGGTEVRELTGAEGGPEDFVIAILRVLRDTTADSLKVESEDDSKEGPQQQRG